jgi:long-chain acyl-CoA synthetase
MHLREMLRETALRCGDKTALVCRDESVTYRELDRAARRLAHWMLSEGVRPGDRIAIHSTNSVNAVKLLLACVHAGVIAVPVNVRLKSPEVAYIFGHSRPRMCFSQAELAEVAATACAEAGLDIALHTSWPQAEIEGELPVFGDDHLALILYTSGTTARPKGVAHDHASLLGTARTMWPVGISEDTRLMIAVPLMHASGLTALLLPALLAGSTAVMVPVFEPNEVLDEIERCRCTFGLGLPAMMQFLAAEQERNPRDVSSLRAWLAGGDAVPVSLQERFERLFGFPLQEGYAMTESVVISWNRLGAMRAGAMGTAADGVTVRVLDLSGNPVEAGEIGELAVRSGANFVGYWNDAATTAAALSDGWLMTGDLVGLDADGYLWFAGRRKEVIIRGGSNISPQEVEEALYQHPAVMEVGVIGLPDPIYNEQVVACISLRERHSATAAELIEFARVRLADYKLPSRVVFLPALPKGITGKVQRRALKEMAVGAG